MEFKKKIKRVAKHKKQELSSHQSALSVALAPAYKTIDRRDMGSYGSPHKTFQNNLWTHQNNFTVLPLSVFAPLLVRYISLVPLRTVRGLLRLQYSEFYCIRKETPELWCRRGHNVRLGLSLLLYPAEFYKLHHTRVALAPPCAP